MVHLEFASRLSGRADRVWARAITPQGVNAELMPLVRMTFPLGVDVIDERDIELGAPLCRCWMLAGGVVPFDRHTLAFERMWAGDEGYGFAESSTSWLQARWLHERTVVPIDTSGCEVTDRVAFEPRAGWAAPIATRLVRVVFAHRHRRLRAAWGSA